MQIYLKADNLHGDLHDVNGQHQDGGHQWEPPQPLQAPGQIKKIICDYLCL